MNSCLASPNDPAWGAAAPVAAIGKKRDKFITIAGVSLFFFFIFMPNQYHKKRQIM